MLYALGLPRIIIIIHKGKAHYSTVHKVAATVTDERYLLCLALGMCSSYSLLVDAYRAAQTQATPQVCRK